MTVDLEKALGDLHLAGEVNGNGRADNGSVIQGEEPQ
jgi:hypothetical protein